MKTLRVVLCLLCAILFGQLPSFSNQYIIRLEAHFFELQKIKNEYTLREKSPGPFAEFLQERYDRLQKALERMTTSQPVFHPFWMIWGYDQEIAQEAWERYTPSLFFDFSTFVWGLFGAILCELALNGFARIFRRQQPLPPV